MRRRTLIFGVVAAAGTSAAAACGHDSPAATSTSPAPDPAATGPVISSTAGSSLPSRNVTPYAPPAGTAPTQAFAVGQRDFPFARGDRALPTRVWYPAAGPAPVTGPSPADGAPPAPGRFPVIVFSHGLTSLPEDYAPLLARWAQAGFVVAGPAYPHTTRGARPFDPNDVINQPADASHVLDQMLALGSGDPLRPILDQDRLAAAGHSAGGITTVGLFSKDRDQRLKAGFVMAGSDFLGAPFAGPPAAMLFVHGKKDATVVYDAGHTVFQAVPWSRALLSITDGGHVITGASFETITQTATEFWRWALYGDAAAKGRVPAAAAVQHVATLADQL